LSYLFTSESVSEGHPDKVADAISDAILDLVMVHEDPSMRVACETLVTTNRVVLAGEYKNVALHNAQIDSAVRKVIKNIGYEQEGFDWRTVEITNLLHAQSADIALGTDNFGAGDQGLMFGHATKETPNYMPAAIYYSHKIMEYLTTMRKGGQTWLGPDAKAQVTLNYIGNKARYATKIVCSTQHSQGVEVEELRPVIETYIRECVPEIITDATEFLINPTGRFVIGGPDGDTGLTGRKIIVDTYGGSCPHGGGAFSGKDPTKVDRSAAYMARYLAKNIVASGRANVATVQLSYAIGVADPMSVYIDCDGNCEGIRDWIIKHVDLTPKGIIDRFNMFRPIYSQTTNYGHFGKDFLPWEAVDLFKV